ncbi:PIG-L deacetylase family protein [Halomonas sp. H10-9-1]|uniref:PIG-L deacetylase family protein n=1 Tax=Halomonas sp. H10-9-1 TaxID=2950871 RepID=UPI0032DF361D
MKRILVIAAHSDDEVLGCGGSIAAQVDQGAEVSVVFLTNGVGARNTDSNSAIERRMEASRNAGKILGVKEITQRNFPDNRLDSIPLLDIVQSIEPVIADLCPSVILTHHAHDLNIDHRVCHQAVLTACRPQPKHPVKTILGFEVASSTEWAFSAPAFVPNYYVDISSQLDKKLRALDAYREEMRPAPHPRSASSVEALARWRGATVGCSAAEAFSVVRMISGDI